jgi:hypothetical protein
MHEDMDWSVTIEEHGRDGAVFYREGDRVLRLYWEFGGGGALAIVSGPPPQDWDRTLPWTIGRRSQIMDRVAHEVIRQKAPGCKAEFGDDFATILIAMPTLAEDREAP